MKAIFENISHLKVISPSQNANTLRTLYSKTSFKRGSKAMLRLDKQLYNKDKDLDLSIKQLFENRNS